MIELRRVSKSFGDLVVLREANISIRRGEVVGIIGPSGSGKTTMLRIMAGLTQPDSGEVVRASDRIGYVFQEPRLLPWRSARDNIALVLQAEGKSKTQARQEADEWIGRLGLEGFGHHLPWQLSGGMMQRVSIGRAFAIRPDILLLDEPFSGLDRTLRNALLCDLKDLIRTQGVTAAYVTHELPEALYLCDRIFELAGGGAVRELDARNWEDLLVSWVSLPATHRDSGHGRLS